MSTHFTRWINENNLSCFCFSQLLHTYRYIDIACTNGYVHGVAIVFTVEKLLSFRYGMTSDAHQYIIETKLHAVLILTSMYVRQFDLYPLLTSTNDNI